VASVLVPVGLFTLALVILRLGMAWGRRRARRAAEARPRPALLIHSINDDRCTGCEACVAVCPTDVLALVANHARVARFEQCIQCNMCEMVCPTRALAMHLPDEEPRPLRLPQLDEFYQTNVPGLYLIGEAAGKPLTKNASNLGRAAVEHMRKSGLRAGAGAGAVDVAIVGSGPGGLSAALSCIEHGLSYVVLDKENIPFSTVARYPKGKHVMAEPVGTRCLGLLPVWDAPKDDIVRAWTELVTAAGVRIDLGEVVQRFGGSVGDFQIITSRRTLRARRVILATGTRGRPRKLGVPGEALPKVSSMLDDPQALARRDVLIVGGGDSAGEAVIACAEAGARVTLSYRGKQLVRVNPSIRDRVARLIAARRVQALWGSQVVEILPDRVVLKLEGEKQRELTNQVVLSLIGAEPPTEWLTAMGVRYIEVPHRAAQPRSDQLIERLLGPNVPDSSVEGTLALVGQMPSRQRTTGHRHASRQPLPDGAAKASAASRPETPPRGRPAPEEVSPPTSRRGTPPPAPTNWSNRPRRRRPLSRPFDEPEAFPSEATTRARADLRQASAASAGTRPQALRRSRPLNSASERSERSHATAGFAEVASVQISTAASDATDDEEDWLQQLPTREAQRTLDEDERWFEQQPTRASEPEPFLRKLSRRPDQMNPGEAARTELPAPLGTVAREARARARSEVKGEIRVPDPEGLTVVEPDDAVRRLQQQTRALAERARERAQAAERERQPLSAWGGLVKHS
jgi:thioredoxin reductase/NAD-dependent dihydropyrimidine dehydrogenase PreA subunit